MVVSALWSWLSVWVNDTTTTTEGPRHYDHYEGTIVVVVVVSESMRVVRLSVDHGRTSGTSAVVQSPNALEPNMAAREAMSTSDHVGTGIR